MRINIDSEFLSDPRVTLLAQALGVSIHAARGHLLPLWFRCYKETREVLTDREVAIWGEHAGLPKAILEADLAELTDGGLRIRGAAARFQWVAEKKAKASAAGKASAAVRKERTGSAIPTGASNCKNSINSTKQGSHQVSNQTEHPPNERSELCSENPNTRRTKPNAPAPAPAPALCSQEQTQHSSSAVPQDDQAGARLSTNRGPSPRDLAEVWNQERKGSMPAVAALAPSGARWRQCQARLRDHPELDWWRETFRRFGLSSFLRGESPGKNGGPPWRATFDWAINPTNLAKVLDGNYDDRGTGGIPDDFDAQLTAAIEQRKIEEEKRARTRV